MTAKATLVRIAGYVQMEWTRILANALMDTPEIIAKEVCWTISEI